jgi:flagellar hook protein FlgE
MSFNTAVSGLRAAGDDLSIIGNNVANASTPAFKASRGEFGDVYASSVLGTGSNTIGSGVFLNNVSQQFTQGNVAFTNNSLDMAVNGNGFYIMSDEGAVTYTRAGIFSLDKDGFITNNQGDRLQGFPASASGSISGNLDDLSIITDNLPPQLTQEITTLLNVDASETVPAERGNTAASTGAAVGRAVAGADNGYGAETITVTNTEGVGQDVVITANQSAQAIASAFNTVDNVSATALTTSTLDVSAINVNGASPGFTLTLNGVDITANGIDPQDIAISINNLTNTTLPGITSVFDEVLDTITITSNSGSDLSFVASNTGLTTDAVTVVGSDPAQTAVTLDSSLAVPVLSATVGGTVTVQLQDDTTMTTDGGTALSEVFGTVALSPFVNNEFDPLDQETYNHATSVNIFDSLGNAHVMSMYFVKESDPNAWSLYVQVDGEDIGDPNTALDPPLNTAPTRRPFSLQFEQNGSLSAASDEIFITFWNPGGGAQGSQTVADGGSLPLDDPPTSSNFVIDLAGSSQFGSPFSVNSMSQNGFTTGRLAGVDISSEGIIFARYTNGQSRLLGQIALASFPNVQGLQPQGQTGWAETFDSGTAVIGNPGSASLGVIQASSLEESNVDLSQELVALIVAQRNFQANARTIQTSDAVTQSIINIR